MEKGKKFCIDFFEFSFLVEACIPPRPIARSMFWDKVINKYYHQLTKEERKRLYGWIDMNLVFQDGIEKGNEDCLLFKARFDPDNQYLVHTKYEGKEETHECFLYNERFHTSSTTSIIEIYIIKIEKLCGE